MKFTSKHECRDVNCTSDCTRRCVHEKWLVLSLIFYCTSEESCNRNVTVTMTRTPSVQSTRDWAALPYRPIRSSVQVWFSVRLMSVAQFLFQNMRSTTWPRTVDMSFKHANLLRSVFLVNGPSRSSKQRALRLISVYSALAWFRFDAVPWSVRVSWEVFPEVNNSVSVRVIARGQMTVSVLWARYSPIVATRMKQVVDCESRGLASVLRSFTQGTNNFISFGRVDHNCNCYITNVTVPNQLSYGLVCKLSTYVQGFAEFLQHELFNQSAHALP